MSDFIIRLDKTSNRQTSYSFVVKDKFFETFTFSDIKHADIIVAVKLNKQGDNISANLKINGHINKLACDICTEELSKQISAETNIIIKKTNENIFSTDEIIYVKPNHNELDLKQLIFELIILNTPKKRQHGLDENGNSKCDKEMIKLINKYTNIKKENFDPRWEKLKNLT